MIPYGGSSVVIQLSNGKVLAAGGTTNGNSIANAELYNTASNTWTATAPMIVARQAFAGVRLLNGKILVMGGYDPSGYAINSAEIYDPNTGIWTLTGYMVSPRALHTATLLTNGKVLVAGGIIAGSNTELYDPSTGRWVTSGVLSSPRIQHTATLLPNGNVLLAGGIVYLGGSNGDSTNGAELFDPISGKWTPTSSMISARDSHAAVLLANGMVLISGGLSNLVDTVFPPTFSKAEVFDSVAGTWTATSSMNMARNGHSATLLPNGNVLIAGGITAAFTITSTTELYVPVIGAIGTSIANSTKLPNGTFQIVFPYFPLSTNTVVATGELGLISSNWAVLGAAPEFSPGIFLFTDIQTTTNKQRFYRVRSP